MTLQAKTGAKHRRVISASNAVVAEFGKRLRIRVGGSSLFSAFAPPLRFSARARIVLKRDGHLPGPLLPAMNTSGAETFRNSSTGWPKLVARHVAGFPAIHCDRSILS